ncbi:prolyl oligopeptidase family serine peptidase [Flavobacterium sp. Sd200]|uniref:prolyl oligopeptidase family serine peptidase n=1 Tax=Flavobacterium sp. Sd200 TaxID=2692211 RepID=UPI001369692B|nr:prolyl oligopeptidase family serine peptidase [Flavobacterium sp. Sd200]MXN93243.1 prolyl oligopeptidase family serine peptidase [Flavobacterium sp. Sd200]
MKKTIVTLAMVSGLGVAAQMNQNIPYPKTQKGTVTDNYFGTTVPDPYRWLEDDRSAETAAWVKAENEVTFNYLKKIPFRDAIKTRLEKLWNYERISAPFNEGSYTYYFKNNGLQNQSVLYRKDKSGKEEVFLDPNTFSKDGTTSLSNIEFNKTGTLLAYMISEGGSDWGKIILMDAITKKPLGETIENVKFSGIAWKGSEGFYYSTYDKPDGSLLSAKTDEHKLYYHKLGAPQKEDRVVFGNDKKRRYIGGMLTEDERFLIISAANSSSGGELYIQDLSKPGSPIITMADNFDSDSHIIDNVGSTLYISTNYKAPNTRIVTVDAANPQQANWKDLIPETENVLSASAGSGYIFAHYIKDAISSIKQYDHSGKLVRNIELPGIGSAGGFGGKKNEKTLYYSFTNYTTPGTIFAFNPKTGKSAVYRKPNVDFNSDDYTSEQVFYTSKDGTKVPMIITYKKGTKLNGTNPTILYAYGGFNVSLTPAFSIANAVWLENGGIYAVANLRGGGEYGKKWHDAGTKLQKQNVFDDFIAAAEFLIEKKYTSGDYLAVRGGSNGGLLVGAVTTQRPDLFKVALPAVGVMDMLRYHTFTAGAGWAYDYGTSEDSKEMFEYLKKYSPVHSIKKDVKYPATFITTGDHDDRVVPAHSFKYAATLQEYQAGPAPVLIRIEVNAGHGAGKSVAQTIAENADLQAFTLYNMGASPKSGK